MSVLSKSKLTGASDAEVIALLERYKCPVPFHEVRTRFLGNIASPVLGASPMETIKQLWGGELPEFDSMEDLNELFNVLISGLWNRLTAHQSSRNPFRLLRFEVAQTREGLNHLALVRRQELDGFVEGLFGLKEHIDLPERAHKVLEALVEIRGPYWQESSICSATQASPRSPMTSRSCFTIFRNSRLLLKQK